MGISSIDLRAPRGAVLNSLLRYDHHGRMIPVDIPIGDIDYIWIRDRKKNKEELDGLYEFEGLLRNGDDLFSFSGNQQERWKFIKDIYQDMVAEMERKRSANIIDGMRDPFLVRWYEPEKKWVPLKGNQRLCALRAEGYMGNVPCRIR